MGFILPMQPILAGDGEMPFIDAWLEEVGDIDLVKYGLFGDYFGGFLGTIVSVIALIIVFFTWRTAKKSDYRNAIINLLAEMLKTHDGITAGFPGVSAIALREFAHIYKATRRVVSSPQEWSADQRVDISYVFMFFGPSTEALRVLERYGHARVMLVHNEITRLRDRYEKKSKPMFKGHQEELSHYMRNLFSMFMLVEESKLGKREKQQLGKIIRTKLSNYDQALLALNIISTLGREWEQRGLVDKYKPISNIPLRFFGYAPDLSLKERFPNLEFEWEKNLGSRSRYFPIQIGRVSVTFAISGHVSA
jgi:hypothetical protein